jgi:hypothetical protein
MSPSCHSESLTRCNIELEEGSEACNLINVVTEHYHAAMRGVGAITSIPRLAAASVKPAFTRSCASHLQERQRTYQTSTWQTHGGHNVQALDRHMEAMMCKYSKDTWRPWCASTWQTHGGHAELKCFRHSEAILSAHLVNIKRNTWGICGERFVPGKFFWSTVH